MAAGVALASFGIYMATLSPGLTFEHYGSDGGDLIAAAHTLGIPHPTGYPTFTLLASLFSRLPVGTIAYRVNLLSATCAAASAGIVCRSIQILLSTNTCGLLISAASGLALAFSSLLWSQAVITEVYTLLALFAALLLWLLLLWRHGGGDHLLWLAGLVLGVGLGNHVTLAAVVPAALVLLWPYRRRWLRLRILAPTTLLLAAGLGIYAYIPIAASHHPPVNWGNARTWDRFLWLISAKQYGSFAFQLPPQEYWGRLQAWCLLLGRQFGWWGLAIALVGLGHWFRRDRALALFTLVWAIIIASYAFFYSVADSHVYLLPAFLLMAIWWAGGGHYLLTLVNRNRTRRWWLVLLVLAALPFASLAIHWQESDLSGDWSDHAYSHQVVDGVEPDGLLIVRRDRPTFASWYAVYAEERRPDVTVVNGPLLAYIWYREHVSSIYPDLVVPKPHGSDLTYHDLVRDLILDNIAYRPVYATDPREEWYEWFEFVPQESGVLYKVQLRTLWESSG